MSFFDVYLLLLLVYAIWQVLPAISFYLREYCMLCNIVMAGKPNRRSKVNVKMRLYTYVCHTDLLDESSISELYKFLLTMMDADTTVQEFHKIALSYTHAVLYRERNDGSLRGIMFVGVDRKKKDNGNPYTVIRIGLSFFQPNYRGGPYMYSFAASLFFKESITHPLTPLYVVGRAFSYKSYCVMAHSLQYSYPRYDHETPDFMRDIINQYGLKTRSPTETYNMDTYVLERERVRMKDFVAIVDENALKDPHIKFFVDRNPGWAKGHQLFSIGLVKWSDVFWITLKSLTKAKQGREKGMKYSNWKRRMTFQLESSNKYLSQGRKVDTLFHHHHEGDSEDLTDLDQW